jgi:hypothetical protein
MCPIFLCWEWAGRDNGGTHRAAAPGAPVLASWSRSMRRTVAAEGCRPFRLPVVMTRRDYGPANLFAANHNVKGSK